MSFLPLLVILILLPIVGIWSLWQVHHPATQRSYYRWCPKKGVIGPLIFSELRDCPPDTLICTTHQGSLNPSDWYDLKDFNHKGELDRAALGWPPQRPSGLISAFLGGPQPPDLTP